MRILCILYYSNMCYWRWCHMILAVHEARGVNWIWFIYREKSSQQVHIYYWQPRAMLSCLILADWLCKLKLLSALFFLNSWFSQTKSFQHPTFQSISIFMTRFLMSSALLSMLPWPKPSVWPSVPPDASSEVLAKEKVSCEYGMVKQLMSVSVFVDRKLCSTLTDWPNVGKTKKWLGSKL